MSLVKITNSQGYGDYVGEDGNTYKGDYYYPIKNNLGAYLYQVNTDTGIISAIDFNDNDLFVLFSDGISETKGRDEDDFDISGVSKIILKHNKKSLPEICERVFESVRKHGRQTDDRTLMLIRIKGDKSKLSA